MAICSERVVPLAFHLCCFKSSAVLVVRVPFPFGVWGRMWNSIVSVPDHYLFIYFGSMKSYVLIKVAASALSLSNSPLDQYDFSGRCLSHNQDPVTTGLLSDAQEENCKMNFTPVLQSQECLIRGTGGCGLDPGPRHTKVVKIVLLLMRHLLGGGFSRITTL